MTKARNSAEKAATSSATRGFLRRERPETAFVAIMRLRRGTGGAVWAGNGSCFSGGTGGNFRLGCFGGAHYKYWAYAPLKSS